MTSVAWRVPCDTKGPVEIRGGLWNIRRLGRSGPWRLWHNEELLSEGIIDDQSGTSTSPLSLSTGSGGEASLRCNANAGDSFRLEILEGDFVAVQLTFVTATVHATSLLIFHLIQIQPLMAGNTVNRSRMALSFLLMLFAPESRMTMHRTSIAAALPPANFERC